MNDRTTRSTGNLGEDIACQYLVRNGFSILARNYRCKVGEVDIVALKNNIIHFVEVKSMTCTSLPSTATEADTYRPEELVHEAKLRKLVRLSEMYVMQHKETREYQIDALGVLIDHKRRVARCRLYEQVL